MSTKLTNISRRVLGSDHELTKRCEAGLEKGKKRIISVNEKGSMMFRMYYVCGIAEEEKSTLLRRQRSLSR